MGSSGSDDETVQSEGGSGLGDAGPLSFCGQATNGVKIPDSKIDEVKGELCGYGGRNFRRAFDPSALVGDQCLLLLGELRQVLFAQCLDIGRRTYPVQ